MTPPCEKYHAFQCNDIETMLFFMQHVDHYSRTKAIAEKLVMGACGTEVKDLEAGLKVCALRCAGIYGEGERRHLPRIVVCTLQSCDCRRPHDVRIYQQDLASLG